jgi:DNA-binding beta-propeller fold protein YncE
MNKLIGNGALRSGGAAPARIGAAALAAALLLGACDGDNLFKPGAGGTGDQTGPAIQIVEPRSEATYPLNQSVVVRAEVSDPAGVRRVEFLGRVHRGDRELGTDTVVVVYRQSQTPDFEDLPADTVVSRLLEPESNRARSSERVWLVVTATDAHGNTSIDSASIIVGGPRVRILSPGNEGQFAVGQDLPIQISASDSTAEIVALTLMRRTGASAALDTIVLAGYSPGRAALDTTVTVNLAVVGSFTYIAAARNGNGITGMDSVRFSVTQTAQQDLTAPSVRLLTAEPGRMELTDSLGMLVIARDNPGGTGVSRLGVTVVATNVTGAQSTTHRVVYQTVFGNPQAGEARDSFFVVPFNIDPMLLPDTLSVQIYAFAFDAAGNCGAAVDSDFQSLPCVGVPALNGEGIISSTAVARPQSVVVTAGRTVRLPTGGIIADAVVDIARQRLYLSNYGRNKVDALNLATMTFSHEVLVGSQPWGLFLNRTGDTLIVANSGGTNISFVDLTLASPQEDPARRLLTPNTVLYEMRVQSDDVGGFRYTGFYYDFSDRPQFIAQDSTGRLLYSTVPTQAAGLGTIRYTETGAGWQRPEVKLLFTADAIRASETSVVLANIDSITLFRGTFSDLAILYDHQPGFPNNLLVSNLVTVDSAVKELQSMGSDVFYSAGSWIPESIGLSDTTFVAASGDGGWVAFGEGASAPTGRIVLWEAGLGAISNHIQVADLVHNASERVHGVGLNLNGSLGVARGELAAYFFTPDMRLQGEFALDPGGAGAAMHPLHASSLGSGPTSLAFVGTGRNSIKVIDTFHFFQRGEIHIRDTVTGPLRASLPLPSDNVGVAPGDPDYIVVKLYGLATRTLGSGVQQGVVVVNVRNRNLQ